MFPRMKTASTQQSEGSEAAQAFSLSLMSALDVSAEGTSGREAFHQALLRHTTSYNHENG